jgi:glycerophosphoryl diester phosphodiesterase
MRAPRPPLVIAHRGASGYKLENTIAAFKAATKRGADAIELDVHNTSDGELLVHHDDRVKDGRHIPCCTAAELARVRLANGESIPTLAQALAAIGKLGVFVELKTLAPKFDDRLLETLAAGPNPAGYAVHSFDHRIIQRLGQQSRGLVRGVLRAAYAIRPLGEMQDAGATDLWQEQSLIDSELASIVHKAKGRLIAWTVNSVERMEQLIRFGVDGICTNYPDVARRTVDALAA